MGCVKGPRVPEVAGEAEMEGTGLVMVEVACVFLCMHVFFPPSFVPAVLAVTEEFNLSTTEVKCS